MTATITPKAVEYLGELKALTEELARAASNSWLYGDPIHIDPYNCKDKQALNNMARIASLVRYIDGSITHG